MKYMLLILVVTLFVGCGYQAKEVNLNTTVVGISQDGKIISLGVEDTNKEGVFLIVDKSINSDVWKQFSAFPVGTKVYVRVAYTSQDNGETWKFSSVRGLAGE